MMTTRTICALTIALAAGSACSPLESHGNAAQSLTPAATCLPGERGYLRAQLRGAIDSELDWRGMALQCEGGTRPGERGLRVSFAGPADAQGRQLRIVFGVAAKPGVNARNAPTNVTVIIEGRNLLYATQGDDKCTVESLSQQPLPAMRAPAAHIYRVAARGYCINPAATLDGQGRLYINRFDFAGLARFEDNELHEETPHS